MAGEKVLVVDDDRNFCDMVSVFLRNDGYQVHQAYDGREGLTKAAQLQPHLVVLDVMMPIMDGWAVCRELRKTSQAAILMLTVRGDEPDKLQGFELGADDYLTKPFSPKELLVRVRAIIRRTASSLQTQSVIAFPPLFMDVEKRLLTVRDQVVDLSTKEFDLMLFLARHPQQVFNRNQLLDRVWGIDFCGDDRTVDVTIKRLRRKLEGIMPDANLVQTVWGVGYRFDPKAAETL